VKTPYEKNNIFHWKIVYVDCCNSKRFANEIIKIEKKAIF